MRDHHTIKLIVISDAVRKNHVTAKASDKEVEAVVKEWLKFAAERDGRRRDRVRAKRSAQTSTTRRRSSASLDRPSTPSASHHAPTYPADPLLPSNPRPSSSHAPHNSSSSPTPPAS